MAPTVAPTAIESATGKAAAVVGAGVKSAVGRTRIMMVLVRRAGVVMMMMMMMGWIDLRVRMALFWHPRI